MLALADGAIFGSVVVIGAKHIARAQGCISPGMLDVPLQAEEWFVFGKANENPVLLNRLDRSIWTFPNMRTTWWASTEFARISSSLSDFVLHYALGPGYLSLTDSDKDDQWWQILRRTGRVD